MSRSAGLYLILMATISLTMALSTSAVPPPRESYVHKQDPHRSATALLGQLSLDPEYLFAQRRLHDDASTEDEDGMAYRRRDLKEEWVKLLQKAQSPTIAFPALLRSRRGIRKRPHEQH
jgi:hypothetical protein